MEREPNESQSPAILGVILRLLEVFSTWESICITLLQPAKSKQSNATNPKKTFFI